MSRIGKKPIVLPENVSLHYENGKVQVEWPLGKMECVLHPLVEMKQEERNIYFVPKWDEEEKFTKAIWGTMRANVNNMIQGVSVWFKKSLEINGVWYKFEIQGKKIVFSLGFSHTVEVPIPENIRVEADQKLKNVFHCYSFDKQKLWQFCCKIRLLKKPEPYKWKWIKYVDEVIRRKAWKTGKVKK